MEGWETVGTDWMNKVRGNKDGVKGKSVLCHVTPLLSSDWCLCGSPTLQTAAFWETCIFFREKRRCLAGTHV